MDAGGDGSTGSPSFLTGGENNHVPTLASPPMGRLDEYITPPPPPPPPHRSPSPVSLSSLLAGFPSDWGGHHHQVCA